MTRYILLIATVLLFQKIIASAQSIEITVLDIRSQPMPYAYILVNGKPVEVSDTLGIAHIPINVLAVNDTISVSYLGAAPASILYDQSLKESQKYCFYLDESSYSLNEVVVTYHDIEKLFRKSIIKIPQLNYNCEMSSEFQAKLYDRNKKVYLVSGNLQATNEVYSKTFNPYQYGFFHHPIKFITDSDTTKIEHLLNQQTHLALNFINNALAICQLGTVRKIKPSYSFLGEKDNFKIFRISYPPTYIIGFFYSILLYVDNNTKHIKSVEIEMVSADSEENKYLSEFTLKFDCELYTHKKPRMNTIYLPVNVYYNQQEYDGSEVDIVLSNISIN